MKKAKPTYALILAGIVLSGLVTGCGSTRSENGVTIEQDSSFSPRNYLPW